MINIKQKAIGSIITTLIVVTSLFIIGLKSDNEIRKILVVSNLPMVNEEGKLFDYKDDFGVIFKDKFIFYEFPKTVDISVNHLPLRSYRKYAYLGFERDSKAGFFYDSLDIETPRRVSVDSVLTERAFKGFEIANTEDMILIQKLDVKNNILVEKYIPKNKKNYSYSDTTFIYYTQGLKGIDYSFSKKLESIKGMKIKKVVALFNSQYYEGIPIKMPERKLSFEIEEASINNMDTFEKAFGKLKEDIHKLL